MITFMGILRHSPCYGIFMLAVTGIFVQNAIYFHININIEILINTMNIDQYWKKEGKQCKNV